MFFHHVQPQVAITFMEDATPTEAWTLQMRLCIEISRGRPVDKDNDKIRLPAKHHKPPLLITPLTISTSQTVIPR